jgi:DHA1 family inner membrane transport protein
MGLLPSLARTLLPELMQTQPEVGIAQAGHLISAYALGVVIGAPVFAVIATRVSRTWLITGLSLVLAVGALASAAMPTLGLTIGARFLAGLPHGAWFGVASLIAGSLLGPGKQGKGIALAMSGLSIANLVGVPVFTAIGQVAGWRIVYVMVAAVFLVTFGLLRKSLPAQPAPRGGRITDELRALKRRQLWAVLLVITVGFAGSFAIFSYIADITTEVAGADASVVPLVLASAGVGMLVGNVVGGLGVDRSVTATVIVGFAVYVLTVGILNVVAGTLVGLVIAFALMNAAQQILGPAMQAWLMRIAGRSEVLGASIHHAACNFANALGAMAGGAVIAAGGGMRAPLALGLGLAAAGFVLVLALQGSLHLRATRRRLQLATAELPVVPAFEAEALASGREV